MRRVGAHHITPERAGDVFAHVQPRLALFSDIVLLGDVKPGDILTLARQNYSGPLEMGEDLMAIEMGEKVMVRRPGK